MLKILYEQKKYDEALNLLSTLKDPLNILDIAYKSLLMCQIGLIGKAKEVAKSLHQKRMTAKWTNDNDKLMVELTETYINSSILVHEKSYEAALSLLKVHQNCQISSDDHQTLFWYGMIINLTGEISFILENLYDGESFFNQAIEIFDKIDDKIQKSSSLYQLGTIWSKRGNYNLALKLFYDSLVINELIEDHQNIAKTLNKIASINIQKGELNLAKTQCEEAFLIAQKIGCNDELIASLNSLGMICLSNNEIELAQFYYIQALEILPHIHDSKIKGKVFYNVVVMYNYYGDNDSTQELAKQLHRLASDPKAKIILKIRESIELIRNGRIQQLSKAQEILNNLLSDVVNDFDFEIIIRLLLVELFIIELKLFGEQEVFVEVKIMIETLLQLSNQTEAFEAYIDCLIFLSRLNLVEGKLEECLETLDEANFVATHKGLTAKAQKIKDEKEVLRIQASKWANSTNISIIEKVESVHLSDYLSQMKRKLE